jgi:hypothetical protein
MHAPSALNLHPWSVIHLTPNLLPVLTSSMYTTLDPTATHFLFCARNDLEDRVLEYKIASGVSESTALAMLDFVTSMSHPQQWAKHQVYAAVAYAAATHPCTISDDFSTEGISAALDLDAHHVPTLLVTLGNSALHTNPFSYTSFVLSVAPVVTGPAASKPRYRHSTPIRRRPLVTKIEDE